MTISFIQILNLLDKLRVVSYFRREEVCKEFNKEYRKDRIKQNHLLKENQTLESPFGFSPLKIEKSSENEKKVRGMFTVMAI